ncbi:hypothetical protein M3Y97_00053200 [Aphelenchoides bicaudatus]|nr:hypothetical protein M3Y97_00053200 [Aphelenchoides bicaudatus]
MAVHYFTIRPNFSTFSLSDVEETGKMPSVLGVVLPHPIIKYFAAFIYLFLGLNGISFNLLWTAILFVGHRYFSQRPFFIVSRHLMLSDILCLIGQLGATIPLTFMDYRAGLSFRRTAFFNYCAILETVGRFSALIFILLQALTQLAPFMPNHNRLVNQISAYGTVFCVFGWCANIGLMFCYLITRCRKDFNLVHLKFFYECSQDRETAQTFWACIYVLTVTIIIAEEFDLILLQGLFIVLMEVFRSAAFVLLPSLAENFDVNSKTLLNVLANCIELLSSSAHPFIYIMFSERAQKYAKTIILFILRKKRDSEHVDGILPDTNSIIRTE